MFVSFADKNLSGDSGHVVVKYELLIASLRSNLIFKEKTLICNAYFKVFGVFVPLISARP